MTEHDTGARREAPGEIDLRDQTGEAGTEQAERGRHAEAPQQIPARGWKDVAKRVKTESKNDNLTLIAGGIAFFALISLAPALAAVVSIYGLVASPEDVTRVVNELTAVPEDVRSVLETQLDQIVSGSNTGLGLGLIVGLALALWGASTAMKHLLVALSTVYDEPETRGFFQLRARALLLTLGGIFFLITSLALIAVAPAWVGALGNDVASTVVSIVRWPVLALMMVVALAVVYRYAPDRDEPRWRWVSWGAGIATVIWLVASVLFSVYVSSFGNYNETYGSMAAIVVMMLWLLISAACVLLGAEINAELEHQTARDSTKGREQPRGQRDAYVADTVGSPAS
jgi:membrane protein